MFDKQPLCRPDELKEDVSIRHQSLTTASLYERDFFESAQQHEQHQQMSPLNHDFEFQSKQLHQRQPISLSQLLAQSRESKEALSSHPVVDHSQESQLLQELRIQQLEAELEEKNAQIREVRNDEKKWRDKSLRLESQVQHLQSLLIEKEKHEEEILQALAQKTSEQIQFQTRCLTLQDANETYQEQAKKAVDEKERVQRDYLQVVYDLGKAQKQLNSISKETIAITEKDFLLREIDQLQKDNEELQQKVKSSDIMGEQRYAGPSSQRTQQASNTSQQPLTLASMGFTSTSQTPFFSPGNDPPGPSNGNRGQQQHFNLEQLKAEAMARCSMNKSGIASESAQGEYSSSAAYSANGYQPSAAFPASAQSRSASFPPVDAAAMAPFATERQAFHLDAVQRRHLEQKLMGLQLEKEQMEAKAVKVEQAGLRTMSARSEKQRLDASIQALAQEVGKLKLTLRY
ncbi:hypothetical protein Gpo141_00006983 [Globisporangium polare]